jgi:hypothetical protein
MESIHFTIPYRRHSFYSINGEETRNRKFFVGFYLEFKYWIQARDEDISQLAIIENEIQITHNISVRKINDVSIFHAWNQYTLRTLISLENL